MDGGAADCLGDAELALDAVARFDALVRQFKEQCDSIRTPLRDVAATKREINGNVVLVRTIAELVAPHLVRDISSWQLRTNRALVALQQLQGILRNHDLLALIRQPRPPILAASTFHPDLWEAVNPIWVDGHYRAAVQTGATFVEQRLKVVLGRQIEGKDAISQAFSLDPPAVGKPRLRFVKLQPGTGDFRSMHEGVANFGRGCFQAIRNIVTHRLDELDEQQALEYLAALSCLVRWIDEAELEQLPGDE